MKAESNKWTCTHTAWFLLCPIYLSDFESSAAVPIPRWGWLWRWLELMFVINDGICWCISFFAPQAVGFMFWNCYELETPIVIEVSSK